MSFIIPTPDPTSMEMFVIITLQKPMPRGFAQVSIPTTVKVRPGTPHMEVFRYVCDTIVPENMRGATVLFYSIQPAVIV